MLRTLFWAEVANHLSDIARRNKEVFETLPSDIKYYPELWASDRAKEDCVSITIMYLDLMYNDFMLQRMLVRRIHARPDEVIRISRILITTLIDMISNHGRSSTLSHEEPWLIVLYGLPAAGVLALELLQQTKLLAKSGSRSSEASSFPRSEIIQNLSVLVSYLGWIYVEEDGNYQLCMQARRMLQRILDRVLSPQPARQNSSARRNTASVAQTRNLDPSLFTEQEHLQKAMVTDSTSVSNTDTFDPSQFTAPLPTPPTSLSNPAFTPEDFNPLDFSWMDNWNAEFETDFWMNLPDHPLLASEGVIGVS